MRFDFELQICVFRSQKRMTLQSKYAKSDRNFFDLRLFPMRFDFELQICIFRSQKRMTLLMQSKYAKSDRNFFDLRIRRPGSSDFQIEKWHAL